jgi:tetratricopeptide (TPR) repeat protein
MRTSRPLTLAAAALALASGIGCAAARPTALRELPSPDLNECYKRAKLYGNPNLKGGAQLFLYVDVDGAVPAAWFHDRDTLDASNLLLCITDYAVDAKFEAEKTDYLRANKIVCTFGDDGVAQFGNPAPMCSKLTSVPGAAFDAAVAKETLTFAKWATDTDKGWGYYYTQQYSEAIAAFRKALAAKADDLRALRGLSQALTESGGDLKEARQLAEKGIAVQKSAATLEPLVRVCLKEKDDDCAVKSFREAAKAPDTQTRSFDLAQLNDQAKAANERLKAAEDKKIEEAKKAAEEAIAKADPLGCRNMSGGDKAVCQVKTCFGEGAKSYAGELKKNIGVDYSVGEAAFAAGTNGAFIVTIPLRGPAPAGKKGKKAAGPEPRDAVWSVTEDDMSSYKDNMSAYNISTRFNACKK